MNGMTPAQNEIFQIIRHYIAEKGYSPSIRDIASEAGLYRTTITRQLIALRNKGFITWDFHIARSIRPVN
jgi:SOS-response transcriptional repressor LexA